MQSHLRNFHRRCELAEASLASADAVRDREALVLSARGIPYLRERKCGRFAQKRDGWKLMIFASAMSFPQMRPRKCEGFLADAQTGQASEVRKCDILLAQAEAQVRKYPPQVRKCWAESFKFEGSTFSPIFGFWSSGLAILERKLSTQLGISVLNSHVIIFHELIFIFGVRLLNLQEK